MPVGKGVGKGFAHAAWSRCQFFVGSGDNPSARRCPSSRPEPWPTERRVDDEVFLKFESVIS